MARAGGFCLGCWLFVVGCSLLPFNPQFAIRNPQLNVAVPATAKR